MEEIKQKAREEWKEKFREEIIGHDDLNATNDKYSINYPIKGDIYFDGVAMEMFIDSLLSQALQKRDGNWRLAIMHLPTEQRESVIKTFDELLNKINI